MTLRNRIGEITSDVSVTLSGGALHLCRALLDGEAWSAISKIGLPGYDPNGLGGSALTGFNGKPGSKEMRSVQCALDNFDPATFVGKLPHTISGESAIGLVSRGVGPTADIWQSPITFPGADGEPNPMIPQN